MSVSGITEIERKEILNAYRGLLRACKNVRDKQETRRIRKAFDIALDAHKDMRRKSGEPYIYHPIAVARIVAEEIGLDPTSIICALLHDTVEDTDITLDDIEHWFGVKERAIIDGLTKLSGEFDLRHSVQAENFRKMLLTLSDDIRVILIKVADRLHNMRTLESMRKDKQLKIASETLFLYAPLAHRLGLYTIKSELEDLSLQYTNKNIYQEISQKLEKTKAVRNRFISRFILPIRRELENQGFKFEIKGRTKSIHSIYSKIKNKKVAFEDIYDLFAIRIILDSEPENEKPECWKVYSIVTDFYQPNPDRLRDWISTPKGNGYESLHATVMSPTGKWVEVQIRTRRMDEVAEKGFAAHWRYKETPNKESSLDSWISQVRELIENKEIGALDFVDEFKLSLNADEVFVFTPDGELRNLSAGATALDFAFEIHTQVGKHCIGAKVNKKLVPLSQRLQSGDQIEILTSKKQTPKEDWLKFVVTSKAKSKIKSFLKDQKKETVIQGKEMLERKLKHQKMELNDSNINVLLKYFNEETPNDFYYKVALEKVNLKKLKNLYGENGKLQLPVNKPSKGTKEVEEQFITRDILKDTVILVGKNTNSFEYDLATCCNPIPGDKVFGFVAVGGKIKIHRETCPNAVQMMSKYAYRIIKAKWKSDADKAFQTSIQFTGIDDVGLVHAITSTISNQLHINMKAIRFESNDGTFEGEISLYITDTRHLEKLIDELKSIRGVHTIERVDVEANF